MPIDTFIAYCGVYSSKDAALEDYEAVHALHKELGIIDAYDAAVIEKKPNGRVKVVKKHETPTRVGGVLGGGLGLATGVVVALFPAAAIGGGLLAGTTAGGAVLGAVAGHAAAGMSRHDLKELGDHLDAGAAGLIIVAVADSEANIESVLSKAEKLEKKEIKADTRAIKREAKAEQDAAQRKRKAAKAKASKKKAKQKAKAAAPAAAAPSA